MTRAALRSGLDRTAAVETVWLLMDPVVFSRLTRNRAWSADHYASWFADSVTRLLTSVHPERRSTLPGLTDLGEATES